jgi:hypothetical protein
LSFLTEGVNFLIIEVGGAGWGVADAIGSGPWEAVDGQAGSLS